MKVVDASVGYKWIVPEIDSDIDRVLTSADHRYGLIAVSPVFASGQMAFRFVRIV